MSLLSCVIGVPCAFVLFEYICASCVQIFATCLGYHVRGLYMSWLSHVRVLFIYATMLRYYVSTQCFHTFLIHFGGLCSSPLVVLFFTLDVLRVSCFAFMCYYTSL